MKKIDKKLSELFDIEPTISDVDPKNENKEQTLEVVQVQPVNTVEQDAEFARTNIKSLINSGSVAMNELLVVARDSQHPRAYEVAANMLKSLADLNKDLLEIQKKKRDLLIVPGQQNTDPNNVNIDKAVFVGSTSDLLKLIKQSNKE